MPKRKRCEHVQVISKQMPGNQNILDGIPESLAGLPCVAIVFHDGPDTVSNCIQGRTVITRYIKFEDTDTCNLSTNLGQAGNEKGCPPYVTIVFIPTVRQNLYLPRQATLQRTELGVKTIYPFLELACMETTQALMYTSATELSPLSGATRATGGHLML